MINKCGKGKSGCSVEYDMPFDSKPVIVSYVLPKTGQYICNLRAMAGIPVEKELAKGRQANKVLS